MSLPKVLKLCDKQQALFFWIPFLPIYLRSIGEIKEKYLVVQSWETLRDIKRQDYFPQDKDIPSETFPKTKHR